MPARLFLYDHEVTLEGTRDEFVERADLVNPARRLTTNNLFSDTRSGSDRAGGRHFGFDDHRMAHLENIDEVFAREISAQVKQLTSTSGARRLVVCASPHMLGLIRRHLEPPVEVTCDELPKDLVALRPGELRTRLAAYGVLPPAPRRTT